MDVNYKMNEESTKKGHMSNLDGVMFARFVPTNIPSNDDTPSATSESPQASPTVEILQPLEFPKPFKI